VLHVLSGMDRGGIETWLMNVGRRLEGRRVRFDFLVESVKRCHYDAEIEAAGGAVMRSPPFRKRVAASRSLLRRLNRLDPYDVIHAHGTHDTFWPLAVGKARGVPVRIGHVHNLNREHTSGWGPRLYRAVATRGLTLVATRVLGCSRAALDSLLTQEALKRLGSRGHVLPYGIDLERFRRHPNPALVRQRLGLPRGSLVLGHVGRFVPQKNHAFLVEVFTSLRSIDPRWVLLAVGEGPLRQQTEALLERRGLMHCSYLLQARDDVPDLMSVMDAFAFPSLWEGLGLVLIEAQAIGVPCVVSEAVPPEAVVDRCLVARVSGMAAREWAGAVQTAAATPSRWAEAHALVSASAFNVDRCVETLLREHYGLEDHVRLTR
jgi:glycosyltransferase involved in cell wall biosynthesis